MKFAVSSLLFIFVSFLSVPTIVTLIEKKVDVSAFYSFSEEEIHKEMKAEFKYNFNNEFPDFDYITKTKIFSENQSDLDLISKEILIPPPKLV